MVDLPADSRYFVSVLPDADRQLGGAPVAVNQNGVKVWVATQPVPTAQISVLAFQDQNPINDGWDGIEPGVGGALITINDFGGPVTLDVFGNPLGTRYDANGAVVAMGTGFIHTLTQEEFDGGAATNPYGLQVGEALVKYIAPGKYGVTVTPPRLDDAGADRSPGSRPPPSRGRRSSTPGSRPTSRRSSSRASAPASSTSSFGFVKTAPATPSTIGGLAYEALPWNAGPDRRRDRLDQRPPALEPLREAPLQPGLLPRRAGRGGLGRPQRPARAAGRRPAGRPDRAARATRTGSFTIPNVPDGTYRLVWWDKPLDALFGFTSVKVEDGAATHLGDILAFRWFGTLQGTVFFDKDEDGFRDAGEGGIPEQNLNLRFRDGSIYQAQPTDGTGEYEFSEVFPFFKWLVAEVDFARYKATGITTAVDNGGAIPAAQRLDRSRRSASSTRSRRRRSTPNTGNALSRTETGPVLTQAMHLFLNQTNVIDWGKANYAAGENGGISGIVFYDTTRAEDDAVAQRRGDLAAGHPRRAGRALRGQPRQRHRARASPTAGSTT